MEAVVMTELTVITLGVDRCNSFMKRVSTIINHKIPIHVLFLYQSKFSFTTFYSVLNWVK